ncbi:MAG: hypothetical protein ACE5H9_13475 [Anaerolineae bacterium]
MTSANPPPPPQWRWAIAWAGLVVGLSALPYIVAGLTAPPGWQFSGLLINPFDANSYLAKMRQGWQGNWLFHLTYTPEPHPGSFIFTFYLFLGHLARWLGLPLIWVYHLARSLGGFFLLIAAYDFVALWSERQAERRLAFVLIAVGGGLGWLGAALGAFPIDLWVPEGFTFYSLYANPHFPLAVGLMLVIFKQTLAPGQTGWRWLGSGLAALALAVVQPFALLTVLAVLGILAGLTWARDRGLVLHLLGAGLAGSPILLYDYTVSRANDALAAWSAQNVTPAPAVLDLILGYGLLVPLAAIGFWPALRRGSPPERLIAVWAGATVILVYIPFALQRRLIIGLHIPLCLLAALAIYRHLAPRLSARALRRTIGGVVGVGLVGTLFIWLVPLIGARQSPAESGLTARLYLREEEVAALAWLRTHADAEAVILAPPRLGMFVPGLAGTRVFYGHPFETIEAEDKRAQVEAFFAGTLSPAEQEALLRNNAVDYVVCRTPRCPNLNAAGNDLLYRAGAIRVLATGSGLEPEP